MTVDKVAEPGLAAVGMGLGFIGVWAAVEPASWVVNFLALIAGIVAISMRIWDRFQVSDVKIMVDILTRVSDEKSDRIRELEDEISDLLDRITCQGELKDG